jgi:hypothetical protein
MKVPAVSLVAVALFCMSGAAGHAQTSHLCSADAAVKARALLALHLDDAELAKSLAVDPAVKVLAPAKALKGSGRFDVLELWGHVYKADYRIRFLYAQIKGSCVLMGQEVLDAGNPY